jgi:hypothetical protein
MASITMIDNTEATQRLPSDLMEWNDMKHGLERYDMVLFFEGVFHENNLLS